MPTDKGLTPELLAKLKRVYDEEVALQTAGSVKVGTNSWMLLAFFSQEDQERLKSGKTLPGGERMA